MKIPTGFLDANGKTAKGEVILTIGEDQVALQEFGTTTEGNKTSCYVLTSPGDIPTMRFALNANIADHADLVVDGVLRNCVSASLSKTFKGAFEKVIYQGRKSNSKRAAVKYSKMQVKERGTIKDMTSTNSSTPSAVGSFEVRLYRTDPETSDEATPGDRETLIADRVERAPAYDKYAEWYDCNSNLNFEGTPPPFQIEFIDHKEASKAIKDRVLKDLAANCKLWAAFVFHLRSTADLRHLGFDCPTYYSTQSLLSPTALAESKASKAEGYKQKLDVTSVENTLVGDFVAHTARKNLEGAEVQKIKAPTRPAPVLAPRTTLTGLLNVMSNANRVASLGARENSEDRCARGSMTPSSNRSNHGGTLELVPRHYSSQGLGLSNIGAGRERVPVLQSPEPVTATTAFNTSKDVQPKQEPVGEYNIPRKSQGRGPAYLPGVTGVRTSPAHKAFLERPVTQESESREATPTPTHDYSFSGGGDNFTHGQQTTPDVSSRRRGTSQPPEALASMEGGKLSLSGSQGEMGSTWKPMTPPAASLKRQAQTLQRGSVGLDDIWGRPGMALSSSFAKDPLLSINSEGSSTNPDYLLPGTFPPLSQLASPQNSNFTFLKPAIPGINNQSESLQYQVSSSRAPSEVPSDTDTEVADPDDIERAVRASQRSTQTTNTSRVPPRPVAMNDPSFKSDSIEDEQGNHTNPSPVLGSRRFSNPRSGIGSLLSRSFTAHTESPPTLGSPAQHIRENLQPKNISADDFSSSENGKEGTLNNLPSTQAIKKSESQPTTPLKRKSYTMTGSTTPDPFSPRKTSIAPAERNQKFENDKAAAEARIAAAERKREELQTRLEAARELKREMNKVQELNQKAADVERENAEMEAEIASIYGVKNKT